MNLLIFNIYEVSLLAVLVLAYSVVRHHNSSTVSRLSYLAVFSAICGVLNPEVIFQVLLRLHLAPIVSGNTKVTSCLTGFVAVISALVAFYRIHRSGGAMHGRAYAIIGLVTGLPWMLFWVILMFLFVSAMKGMQ